MRVASPCGVKRKRCPPESILMCGTIRTCLFLSNSRSSCTTLPKPLRSHSNLVPSPISPSLSRRDDRMVGFHPAKLPPSTTVPKTSPTGALMIWVRVRIAIVIPSSRRCAGAKGDHAALPEGRCVRALASGARPACGGPLLIGRHRLADDIQEVIGAAVADEPELPLEVSHRLRKAAMRAQVPAEAAIFGVELKQRLGVVYRRLDLGAAAHDPGIGEQPLDVGRPEVGDRWRIEAGKGVTDALPLGVYHPPAHPGLKNGPAQRLQVAGEIPGPMPRRGVDVHHGPPWLSRPAVPRTAARTVGRRRRPTPRPPSRRGPGTTRRCASWGRARS